MVFSTERELIHTGFRDGFITYRTGRTRHYINRMRVPRLLFRLVRWAYWRLNP